MLPCFQIEQQIAVDYQLFPKPYYIIGLKFFLCVEKARSTYVFIDTMFVL